MHENYGDINGISNDICLLKVPTLSDTKPADCDGCYAPICLPEQGAPIPHGKACFVSGWGKTSSGGSGPAQLNAVAVNVMSHQYCTDNALHDGIVPGAELCAAIPDLNNDGIIDVAKMPVRVTQADRLHVF